MALTTILGKGFQGLAGIAFPILSRTSSRRPGRILQWLLHLAVVAAIVVGLWYLNGSLNLGPALRSPWPELHQAWLPLLFALVYLASWLGAWFWCGLLDLERPAALFPDIDKAWGEAMHALQEAGINLQDMPLFLILGRPASGQDNLFQASGNPLVVPRTPNRSDAPVHVCANREAIFVTCAESSLLGRQAKHWADQNQFQPSPLGPMQFILAQALAQGRGPDQLTKEEKQDIKKLVAQEKAAPGQKPAVCPLLTDKLVLDQITVRLDYLCRLLADQRRPYCPINGLALLIPLAAATGETEANHVAALARHDVQTVHQVLQIDCPFYVLVCDLEEAPGFREFIETIPEAARRRPLGQRFPLVPDIDAHEMQGVMEKGLDSLGRHVLPKAIFQSFRHEPATSTSKDLPVSVRANFRLYQLLTHLRAVCTHLGQILYRGTQTEPGTSAMVAGCYFVATGADAQQGQAFAADVFQEILQNQNYVAWSPQALISETAYRRFTRLGYLGLAFLIFLLGMLGYVGIMG